MRCIRATLLALWSLTVASTHPGAMLLSDENFETTNAINDETASAVRAAAAAGSAGTFENCAFRVCSKIRKPFDRLAVYAWCYVFLWARHSNKHHFGLNLVQARSAAGSYPRKREFGSHARKWGRGAPRSSPNFAVSARSGRQRPPEQSSCVAPR